MVPVVSRVHVKRILTLALFVVALLSWFLAYHLYGTYREEVLSSIHEIVEVVLLPYKMARLSASEPTDVLFMPIVGIEPYEVADTWNAPREGGRVHEGIDIFAERGTPVFSSTVGYVLRSGVNDLGGNSVLILGPGGVRYYYAHFDRIAYGMKFGTYVTTDSVIGFVGNTGNASGTPPHLHFGVYRNDGPENPYPLLHSR